MKGILKVILISMLVTVGALALFVGGMWLFGGFNQQEIYANDLSFNESEVISSRTFALQVNTATENVNQTTLTLETSPGGGLVIDYPRTITIGEPFSIMPVTDTTTGDVHGGVVTLYARYTNTTSSQNVVASCKILIDARVESVETEFSTTELKTTDTLRFASMGQDVTEVLTVDPIYSLMPYRNKSEFGSLGQGSIFASPAFSEKKIFLALLNAETGLTDTSAINFRVGGVLSPIIEAGYSYDASSNTLKFNNDIDIVPTGTRLGEIILRVFVCPTYSGQGEVSVDNVLTNSFAVSSSKSFIIRDYSIDGLNISEEDAEVYFDDEIILYLNNENASASGGINLGVELVNNSGIDVDDYYLRNNVFVSIGSDINDRLTRLDGSGEEEGEINVNYTNIDASNRDSWGLRYYYNDFSAYYNYKNASTNDNKIRVNITFRDFENEYTKTFYLIPRAKEIESISPNYVGTQDRLTFESSSIFDISENNFIYTFNNGVDADFNSLMYHLPFSQSNNIVTIPEDNGRYKLEFSFTPNVSGIINSFSVLNSWGTLSNATLTLTQGERELVLSFDVLGALSGGSDFIFEAGVPVSVVLTPISKTANVNQSNNLFRFNIGDEQIIISARSVKFYTINSSGTSTLPYLYVNDVEITADYEFVTINTQDYLRLEINSETRVIGIGSFVLRAENVYESQGVVYTLGVGCDVLIYVYENITELNIFDYTDFVSNGFNTTNTLDENLDTMRYFYVTSSQLETLRRLKESGQLKIDFVQDFSETNATLYEGIDDINSNAITFGEFEEVYDGGVLVGYMVSYTINEIYSIEIEGKTLSNNFDIRIYVDNGSGDVFYGNFNYNNNTTSEYLRLSINDLIYRESEIVYLSNSGEETTFGATSDNPLSLRATVVDGGVGWSVLNSGETVTSLSNLRYGFKYNEIDTNYSIYGIRYNLIEIDPDFTLSGVNSFFSFEMSEGGGGLEFRNVPYVDGGILMELSIYATSDDDEFVHFVWDGNGFTKVINENLREENSAKMYFRVEGFNIQISANPDFVLSGTKDATYDMFGNNGMFTISGASGISDYSLLFDVSVNSSNIDFVRQEDNSTTYSSFQVLNDFLTNTQVTFSFYYNTGANPLYVTNLGGGLVDGYVIEASGAYEVDILKTSFDAPSRTLLTDFVSVTYLGDTENESRAVGLSVLVVNLEDEDIISIQNGEIVVKTFIGERRVTLRVTLTDSESGNASSQDVEVVITSLYKESDIILTEEEDEDDSKLTINAGNVYNISLNSVEDVSQLNITLTSVTFNFESEADDVFNDTNINDLMKGTFTNVNNITYYANDINYEKEITMTLTFNFSDGGSFSKSFVVLVKQNLTFNLSATSDFDRSGRQLLIDTSSVSVLKNGSNILTKDDLSADKFSFVVSDDESGEVYENAGEILSFSGGGEDNIYLNINYDPNHTVIPAGSNNLTVRVTITFEYETEFGYTLNFSETINVLLLISATGS